MKKTISLLLVLILVMSLVPMTAAATDYRRDSEGVWYSISTGAQVDAATNQKLEYEYWEWLGAMEAAQGHPLNDHTLGWAFNAKYHWLQCGCGHKISMERHVDPKDAANDYCSCGYHFSSNADLVTLWVKGCAPIEDFDKNTTEYTLKAYTYKDVKEIKFATRTFDSEATVEYPEDLTLKEGENKFEVKVTAENQKVTKTYTVTIIKEAK